MCILILVLILLLRLAQSKMQAVFNLANLIRDSVFLTGLVTFAPGSLIRFRFKFFLKALSSMGTGQLWKVKVF